MQTASTNATANLATSPGIDRRRRSARRWAVLHAQFLAELPHGADSAATAAMLGSLTAVTLKIEQENRNARMGGDIDGDLLLRLTGQQSRLLRQLRLAAPLEERHPQRRLSMTSRTLESELERRSDEGNGFGELGGHVAKQRERLEQFAKKYNFSIDLCDASKGGRLNEFRLYELLEAGDTARARKLIRRAQDQYDEVRRLSRHDRQADEGGCRQRHTQGDMKAVRNMLSAGNVRLADDSPRDDADETLAKPLKRPHIKRLR